MEKITLKMTLDNKVSGLIPKDTWKEGDKITVIKVKLYRAKKTGLTGEIKMVRKALLYREDGCYLSAGYRLTSTLWEYCDKEEGGEFEVSPFTAICTKVHVKTKDHKEYDTLEYQ